MEDIEIKSRKITIKPFGKEHQRIIDDFKLDDISEENITFRGKPYLLNIPGEHLFQGKPQKNLINKATKQKLSLDTRVKFMKNINNKPNNPPQPKFSNFSINLLGNKIGRHKSPDL